MNGESRVDAREYAMLEEPINVLTDTLIDMLVAILADDVGFKANDAANVEQISMNCGGDGASKIVPFQLLVEDGPACLKFALGMRGLET